jgi:hypothetical protein
MKLPSLPKLSRLALAASVVALSMGCVTNAPKAQPCPAKYSFHYEDAARGFSLCLPAKVKKADSSGFTDGRVVFGGFAVPAGTNLEAKTLIIVNGNYDELQGATPSGSVTVDGVVFQRVQADEGSAGHSTLHVIYTWKKGAKVVHFDFTHLAVNVLNFDPPNRPKEYDRAAQIKLTEEIMSTFKRAK